MVSGMNHLISWINPKFLHVPEAVFSQKGFRDTSELNIQFHNDPKSAYHY